MDPGAFRCPRCGGCAFGRDPGGAAVWCNSNTDGRPLTEGGTPCGWRGDSLDALYEILGRSCETGERDVAERHNEHQP